MTDGKGKYGNNEACKVVALRPLSLYTWQYNVEGSAYDYLTVGSTQFPGASGPDGVKMSKGDAMLWKSDGGSVKEGWKVCTTKPPGECSFHSKSGSHQWTHSQSLTLTLTRLLTLTPTCTSNLTLTHSLTHSLAHSSFSHTLTHSLTHSLTPGGYGYESVHPPGRGSPHGCRRPPRVLLRRQTGGLLRQRCRGGVG